MKVTVNVPQLANGDCAAAESVITRQRTHSTPEPDDMPPEPAQAPEDAPEPEPPPVQEPNRPHSPISAAPGCEQTPLACRAGVLLAPDHSCSARYFHVEGESM